MIALVFFIWWTSMRPVAHETQQIVITGGTAQLITIAPDSLSGIISASAQRECITIDWSARTTDGTYLHTIRSWRDGCDKFYMPLL